MKSPPSGLAEQTRPAQQHEYRVPDRFSLSEGLAILTLFGILFNVLYLLHASEGVFLFLGVLGMAICLVQMRCGSVPRAASMATGVVLLIVWELGTHFLLPEAMVVPLSMRGMGFYLVALVLGLVLGYVIGTLAAGVFLVSDLLTTIFLVEIRQCRHIDQGCEFQRREQLSETQIEDGGVPAFKPKRRDEPQKGSRS